MIPAAQLALMRADFQRTLIDTCTINATVGTPTRTFQPVATNVPCRMRGLKPGQAQIFDEHDMPVAAYEFFLPYNTTIIKDYEIVFNGHTYRVYDVTDDQTPQTFKAALTLRVK